MCVAVNVKSANKCSSCLQVDSHWDGRFLFFSWKLGYLCSHYLNAGYSFSPMEVWRHSVCLNEPIIINYVPERFRQIQNKEQSFLQPQSMFFWAPENTGFKKHSFTLQVLGWFIRLQLLFFQRGSQLAKVMLRNSVLLTCRYLCFGSPFII